MNAQHDERGKNMLNSEQFEILRSFFVALWCSYHKGTEFSGGFWMQRLDSLKISWDIQNRVSSAAMYKENNFIYFSSLLTKLGIDFKL
jgi:hypothetical protein